MKYLKLYEEYTTDELELPSETQPYMDNGVQVNLYSDLEETKMSRQININMDDFDESFNKERGGLIPDSQGFMSLMVKIYENKDDMMQNKQQTHYITWYVCDDASQSFFIEKRGFGSDIDYQEAKNKRLYNKKFSDYLINRYLQKNSSGVWVKKIKGAGFTDSGSSKTPEKFG